MMGRSSNVQYLENVLTKLEDEKQMVVDALSQLVKPQLFNKRDDDELKDMFLGMRG